MPDPFSQRPSTDDTDFTLDLDQVFSRPTAPPPPARSSLPPTRAERPLPLPLPLPPVDLPDDPAPPAPQARNHYKLERKSKDPNISYSHFTKPSATAAAQASLPSLASPTPVETDEATPAFGKKKHIDRLPELTQNKAYEVMKASSILEGAEFISPTIFNRTLKIFGVCLLLGLVAYMSINLFQSSENLTKDRPVVTNPAAEQEARISAARQTLISYLTSKSWKEKFNFIIDPDRLGNRFREYYQDGNNTDPTVTIAGDGRPQEIGGQFWFSFNLEETNTKRPISARLQETPRGYRLDWENFVGLGAMPWKEFYEARPDQPTQMRVHLTPAQSFSGQYADTTKYRSYELRQQSGPPILIGYVDRSSRASQTIDKVTDGNARGVSLNLYLQFDPGTTSTQVRIIDIVEESAR